MISIIITFHNSSCFIEDCLLSLELQTFKEFEALLINDGSTDDSLAIAKKFAKEDPRIKIFDMPKIGFPQAKNIGLDNMQGDYVAFLDSDDIVSPYWLEHLYEIATTTNADISCVSWTEFENVKSIEKRLNSKPYNYAFKIVDKDRMSFMYKKPVGTYMWNKLYNVKLFDDLRFEDVIAMSDTIIFPSLMKRANFIAYDNSILNFYRQHSYSMTSVNRTSGDKYWHHRAKTLIRQAKEALDYSDNARRAIIGSLKSQFEAIRKHIDVSYYIINAKEQLGIDL